MPRPRNALVSALVAYLARLRFPTLLLVTGALFVLDLVLPDALPFADEILLGLLTAAFATWRRRHEEEEEDAEGPDDDDDRDLPADASRGGPPEA